jgi:hypothetical protein
LFSLFFIWESIYNFVFNIKKISNKKKIIENIVYENELLDRLLLYTITFQFGYFFIPIITFPSVNNAIFNYLRKFYYIRKYYKIKHEYFIYLKVKLYFCIIKYLDSNIINISYIFDQNDQLFYNVIKNDHFSLLFKNLLFTYIMYILRNHVYYYYKAIQLSYYYNSKYMFKVVDLITAKNHLRDIFINKNYHKLNSIDYSNSFYTLCISRKADDETKFWEYITENIFYYTKSFSLLWGIIWIIHLYTLELSFLDNLIFRNLLLYFIVNRYIYKNLLFKKIYIIPIFFTSFTSILMHSFGDLIICLFLFLYNFICLHTNLTYYFIKFKLKKI